MACLLAWFTDPIDLACLTAIVIESSPLAFFKAKGDALDRLVTVEHDASAYADDTPLHHVVRLERGVEVGDVDHLCHR